MYVARHVVLGRSRMNITETNFLSNEANSWPPQGPAMVGKEKCACTIVDLRVGRDTSSAYTSIGTKFEPLREQEPIPEIDTLDSVGVGGKLDAQRCCRQRTVWDSGHFDKNRK